jgi:hypothetical protein
MRDKVIVVQKFKKPYEAPRLLVYGEVRVITQTGTKGSNEGSNKCNPLFPDGTHKC